MTGQHRAPKRFRERITGWLEHCGDHRIHAVSGDITDPDWHAATAHPPVSKKPTEKHGEKGEES